MTRTESKEETVENSVRRVLVDRLILEGFRNYTSLDLGLSSGFNVVAGPNAQGKTNLLESLYLLATTRLLRGRRDAEAIQEGRDRALATVELDEGGTRLSISLERGARKRALLNGLALPRAADLIGRLPCVCVSAVDMAIVRGEPADRRLFLDLELSGLSPAYLRHFSLYKRALEQRNALLREARERSIPSAVFEPWEDQLAEHGSEVRRRRHTFIERLSAPTEAVHRQMGGGEAVRLAHAPNDFALSPEEFRLELAENRLTDVQKGGTSIGPHRDDLLIEIEDREARLFGSQGQQRTSVIAIKMACLEVAREELGVPPLLLLDDILSDLDEHRRSLLVEVVLERAGQAVLTCTEASAAGRRILDQAKVFGVRSGVVTAE